MGVVNGGSTSLDMESGFLGGGRLASWAGSVIDLVTALGTTAPGPDERSLPRPASDKDVTSFE